MKNGSWEIIYDINCSLNKLDLVSDESYIKFHQSLYGYWIDKC